MPTNMQIALRVLVNLIVRVVNGVVWAMGLVAITDIIIEYRTGRDAGETVIGVFTLVPTLVVGFLIGFNWIGVRGILSIEEDHQGSSAKNRERQ